MTKYKNKCDRKNVFLKEEFQLINVEIREKNCKAHMNQMKDFIL